MTKLKELKIREYEWIGICEECRVKFESDELERDSKPGHKCKMKKYREEHRCESYIHKYYYVDNIESRLSLKQTKGGE